MLMAKKGMRTYLVAVLENTDILIHVANLWKCLNEP